MNMKMENSSGTSTEITYRNRSSETKLNYAFKTWNRALYAPNWREGNPILLMVMVKHKGKYDRILAEETKMLVFSINIFHKWMNADIEKSVCMRLEITFESKWMAFWLHA